MSLSTEGNPLSSEGSPPRRPSRYPFAIGYRSGQLTVIGERICLPYGAKKRSFYLCRCDCGNEKQILAQVLRRGFPAHCGCLTAVHRSVALSKHGLSHSRIYSLWCSMKQKCYGVGSVKYPYYGGKGIKVCPEWHQFAAFYEWAKCAGYTDDLHLARKDDSGDFEPSNCQWLPRARHRNPDATIQS